ncbi:sugar transferase [Synechococcus sp. CB0101]|uniref:sugar transferase n=1 Tax=Synechococcus sp. CB0101 TaxID=232348 RepID=UPI0002001C1C|nr:sugar transferase [Synechococcus sp. CB0101]QCH14999.1 sugar transferase [Synechococcus sp. CB0101]
MSWRNPRRILLVCAGLDLAGLVGLLALISLFKPLPVFPQLGWLVFTALAYLGLGWLFGSYTVLRWRRLPLNAVLQRVLITGVVTLVVVALARLLLNPAETVWLVHRSTQIAWLLPLMVWSLLMRGLLRRGVLLSPEAQVALVGPQPELELVLAAWRRTPVRQPLRCLSLEQAMNLSPPVVLALAPSLEQNPQQRRLLEQLEERDPRDTSLTTPLNLLERQLERLPPALLPEPWLNYQELPWNRLFSLERQLKRVADLLVAAGLLTLTSPLLLMAALLIWLEDRGPVFYVQQRSGWLGRSFQVLKLRTMQVAPADAPPAWTVPGDRRITRVGLWLRRLRLDELPQLLNVLSGDMSLIGPRPERPEFEQELEARIPHYRKRHWMRPGLSGWAQVCAPYAASVEDSELKLSYDLYYLKHFSTWLDLIILFRTIKTVLKAGGR